MKLAGEKPTSDFRVHTNATPSNSKPNMPPDNPFMKNPVNNPSKWDKNKSKLLKIIIGNANIAEPTE